MKIKMLKASDVEKALPMEQALDACARAYIAVSRGQADMPQRLRIQAPKGVGLFMPAFLPAEEALVVKVVSVFPGNREAGLKTTHAMLMVIDSNDGRPLALMDGESLTSLRTGAGSGAATNALARKESQIMALFGAGGQAWRQVEAVAAVRNITELRIYTPSGRSAEGLAARVREKIPRINARPAASPEEAIDRADIISCATTSHEPVFDPGLVKPGAHINGVGSFTPEMAEVNAAGLCNARIFVDSLAAAQNEAGDLIRPVEQGLLDWGQFTEIGKVLGGQAPGRASAGEITFFKSVGLAAQDAAAASAALATARELGLGSEAEI